MKYRITAAALAVVGLIWFCIPIFFNVFNIGNQFGIAVCILVLAVTVLYERIKKQRKASKPFRVFCRIATYLFILGIVWTVFLTGCMVYGAGVFPHAAPPSNATVVVLGSRVTRSGAPSEDLQGRIQTAEAYLKANPQAKCVVSGGQGDGESATEASVMKTYLVSAGIDASRILMDERSKTTEENLKNSLEVIRKNTWSEHLVIVTDEYHQFRAGQIANGLWINTYPVSSRTPWRIFSACYARELLALTKLLIIP